MERALREKGSKLVNIYASEIDKVFEEQEFLRERQFDSDLTDIKSKKSKSSKMSLGGRRSNKAKPISPNFQPAPDTNSVNLDASMKS